MKADFSGYATKVGLKCSDGRTIMQGAFKNQDKVQVPLVWQHGHTNPENVLGHAILEYRDDGVYAYGFFNDTDAAQHIKKSVEHGDINMLSIWANQLVEKSKSVYHGVIREVSLVLSGANPGAKIENVTLSHDDGDEYTLEDEVIIYTGLELKHADEDDEEIPAEKTIQEIYESFTDEQKEVVHYMLGEVLAAEDELKQSNTDADADADAEPEVDADADAEADPDPDADATADADPEADADADADPDAEATADADADPEVDAESEDEDVTHTDTQDSTNTPEGKTEMTHKNVFETSGGATTDANVLSHSQLNEIVASAKQLGSLTAAMDQYALAHGIENIEVMFPDAQAVSAQPDWVKRRTEWVDSFLSGTKKSPFSKIKSLSADITEADARAKGYITGTLKREEYFSVARRVTEPTTVYKKQKLERDDMIDITEYNVVAWLKAEMRLMLDEEIARAALLGDGRDVSSDDKINEQNIRPIVSDNELYVTTVNVNVTDANSSADEVIDAVIVNRAKYKGTGNPNFYTTETQIAKFLILKDGFGRRVYSSLSELATVLRVNAVIPVEVMEEYPDIVGVIVNPADYTMGSNKGGEVNMFDDFDIDYNQMKYLIETRLCGALTKPKSALVIRQTSDTLVVPAAPLFDPEDGELTIVDTANVVYNRTDTGAVVNAAGSPYTVASGETLEITATPAAGYYVATSDDDDWQFTAD